MINEEKLKNSFSKVKQDIGGLTDEIRATNNNMNNIQQNTHEWILKILEKQSKIEERLTQAIERIHKIEKDTIEIKR
ncbi:MAG: hypothetical protein ACQESF_07445 [Nanobdellota archaeon]